MVVAQQEDLPKENNFVHVFAVMKLNFSHFKNSVARL